MPFSQTEWAHQLHELRRAWSDAPRTPVRIRWWEADGYTSRIPAWHGRGFVPDRWWWLALFPADAVRNDRPRLVVPIGDDVDLDGLEQGQLAQAVGVPELGRAFFVSVMGRELWPAAPPLPQVRGAPLL